MLYSFTEQTQARWGFSEQDMSLVYITPGFLEWVQFAFFITLLKFTSGSNAFETSTSQWDPRK